MEGIYPIVVGDTHGRWSELRKLVLRTKATHIFQVGDFGYWPKIWESQMKIVGETKEDFFKIPNDICEIHFVDGNHEDHDSLCSIRKEKNPELGNLPVEIQPNLYYHPKGTTYKFNGENILFVGGALSIDRHYRTPGFDYFPLHETIGENLFYTLPDENVDTVMSHTCPEFLLRDIERHIKIKVDDFDISMRALSRVFEMYRPKRWFFGHWHVSFKTSYKDCEFICLDKIHPDRHVSFGCYTDF